MDENGPIKVQGDEMQTPFLFIYQKCTTTTTTTLFYTHSEMNMGIKLVNVSLMRVANFLSVPSPFKPTCLTP